MPFPRSFLNDDEEVVLDLRPHWVFMTWPTLALTGGLLFVLFADSEVGEDILTIPLLGVVVVALLWFLWRFARWRTTNLIVTSDRLVVRKGVISKRGREIPLEHINDITVTQHLLERILGAGDLHIESAGERGQEVFHDCTRPPRVQNEIYRQMDEAGSRDVERSSRRRELSPLEQLEKLDDLRQRGVISQAEFDAKKAQLLDRM
ncbi:MAG TPA: PH domain-containing protein [Acidimicrobiales bacterium]|nr:PH domain-containing protein [Acidimicrobiales bacterium]